MTLDGNALGGDLLEVFGVELTAATIVCANCGASAPVAETVVYMRAPGRIARCRTCGAVLIVLVTRREITCVDLRGVASMDV